MESKDIIKALECCAISDCFDKCKKCFYAECDSDKGCIAELCGDALDLINQQQAEIERLTANDKRLKKVQMQLDDICKMHNIIKTEAYKEFVDRLCEGRVSNDNTVILAKCLLKELTGRKECKTD